MTEPSTTLPPGVDPMLTVKQAVIALGLSKRTVWRLISEKKIEAKRTSQRRVGIKASEIARYQRAMPDAATPIAA